jgi:hypothetical protein
VATPVEMVDTLYARLSTRTTDITKRDAYYAGEQSLKYASDKFREFHAHRYQGWADNWCGVVANSPSERLGLVGFRLDDGAGMSPAENALWSAWQVNDMEAQSSQGFLESLIAGRSFVSVWADSGGQPTIAWEHPAQVIVDYDPASPRVRRAALRVWRDDTRECANLYTAQAIYKFERPTSALLRDVPGLVLTNWNAGGWTERADEGDAAWPIPNPLGVVPVVEVPNRPMLGREPVSEIQGAMAMQDAINLLWSYLFTAADFAALPARVVMGQEPPKMPILDDAGNIVGSRPIEVAKLEQGRMLWLTGEGSKIGQWDAASLDVFTNAIEVAVGHLAAQTRTPQHYLIGKMANLSAEALLAAETGLVKKVEEAQTFFTPPMREVFRLIALVQDDQATADLARRGRVQWQEAESRSEAQLVDALQKLSALGFPFDWIAERYGLSATDLQRVREMRELEASERAAMAAASFGVDVAPDVADDEPVEDAGDQ